MKNDKLILHDRRVDGLFGILSWPKLYMVDKNTPLLHCVSHIAGRARSLGGVQNLEILAHGFYSRISGDGKTELANAAGGYGLQLCRENLTLANTGVTAAWKGLFKRITIYSCGAANTSALNQNTMADGKRFCGEVAAWTGAEVIASIASQTGRKNTLLTGGLDMGKWEGQVYRFDPADGKATPFKP